jgi:hypothetical protein
MESVGGGGYPAQTDEERIQAILDEATNTSWDDVPSPFTWANAPSDWFGTRTWTEFGTYTQTYVGQTNGSTTYDVIAYETAETNAMSLMDIVSADVRGRWASRPWNGDLLWRNYGSVAAGLDSPPTSLDAPDLLELNSSVLIGVDEIYNQVIIDNGVDPITSVVALDSVLDFGLRTLPIQSWLVAGDQLGVAQNILSTAARPINGITSVSVFVREPQFDADRFFDAWQNININGAIELTGIPDVYGGDQTVFCSGMTLTYDSGTVFMELQTMRKEEVVGADMWQQISATTTWATYPGTTIWADA